MLARLLRLVLLLQAAVAIGWWLWQADRGEPLAGAIGAVLVLLAPLLTLALQFVFMQAQNRPGQGLLPGHGAYLGPAPPRPRWTTVVAAWWREAITFVVVFGWRQPFAAQAVADDMAPAMPGSTRGVVLIHGFCCNRGLWTPWMRRLHALAVPHVAVDLEPVFGSIDAYVPIVDAAVRRMSAATGRPPLVVGHSMGGLVIRAWLSATGPGAIARVHHVVTIGTPHHGTWMGRLAHARNAREMRLDSDWLRRLRAAEDATAYRHFTCFWSHCDNIVFPASSATLPDADNRHVPGAPHVDLLKVAEVFDEVLRRAREPAPSAPGDQRSLGATG